MRIPSAQSNEFPNDNPALHQGASWICLDPLAAPRLVARPAVIAKVAAERPVTQRPTAHVAEGPRSTLLPPPSNEPTEADEFVARFLARVSLPPAPAVPAEATRLLRMAPIAQFMLDELPSYKVRRNAASVPPPPAHAYVSSPALRLDAVDVDSPLALVESLLPPALDELGVAASAAPMELTWRAEALWSVLAPVPHAYRAFGWDSTPPKPGVHPELVEGSALAEPVAVDETGAAEAVAAVEEAPASVEDPVIEVVQLMEIAPTPEAPAVEVAAVAPAVVTEAPVVESAAQAASSEVAGVYETFVAALSAVLLQRGATRGAAVIANLLEGAHMDAGALSETLVQQLSSAGIGEQRGDQFLVDSGFAQVASGWKTLLSTESGDFSSCAETLDDWATRVVSALLPSPAASKEIRRELRRKGVAAFGMLAAA